MADINNSKLLQTSTGILKKDACVVLVKTEWNAAITDETGIRLQKGTGKTGCEKNKYPDCSRCF